METLVQTCYACPSQWEGKDTLGDSYYFRLRHGNFRVEKNGEEIYSNKLSYDGCMSTTELKIELHHMFDFLTCEIQEASPEDLIDPSLPTGDVD